MYVNHNSSGFKLDLKNNLFLRLIKYTSDYYLNKNLLLYFYFSNWIERIKFRPVFIFQQCSSFLQLNIPEPLETYTLQNVWRWNKVWWDSLHLLSEKLKSQKGLFDTVALSGSQTHTSTEWVSLIWSDPVQRQPTMQRRSRTPHCTLHLLVRVGRGGIMAWRGR